MQNFKDLIKSKGFIISSVAVLTVILTVLVVLLIVKSAPKDIVDAGASAVSDLQSESLVAVVSSEKEVSKQTTSSKPEPPFSITSPANRDTTVTEDHIIFSGKGNPKHTITINGEKVKCDSTGHFTVEKKLKEGANAFALENNGIKYNYTVRYNYIVVKSYSPSSSAYYDSGASFAVNVFARSGSTVTATFNKKTITLSRTSNQTDDETADSDTFVKYSGSFTLPRGNASDINLGKVIFNISFGDKNEKKYSGNIVCKKENLPTVAEVVYFAAETFNGNTTDDDSRPTNNYFPKGTVDYVVGKSYNNGKEYLKLRCGRRVYVTKDNLDQKNVRVTKQYAGKLPSTNKVGFASCQVSKRFTTVTFNTDWKAPFFLDYLPQSYSNPSKQNYKISSFTAQYIDITFCYSKNITGKIDLGRYNPVFSSYKIIKNGSNCKLRLYLRKTGTFYGWNAEYNSKGQLVFTFLHPAQVKAASNKYGANLSGATILIDVGHGGIDSGAVGAGRLYEKERNLYLAKLIKTELEKIGAKVILNRTGDTTLRPDQRCMNLIATKPDYCIAIHHDSSTSSAPYGFGSFYSTPFSAAASKFIYNATISKDIYKDNDKDNNKYTVAINRNRVEWHYYFVARMTTCPVVLTENGFMSSSVDYSGIKSTSVNKQKAEAIVKGIAKYFLSIRHGISEDKYVDAVSKPSSSSSTPSVSNPSSSVTSSAVSSVISSTVSSENSSSGNSSENSSSDDSSKDTVTE